MVRVNVGSDRISVFCARLEMASVGSLVAAGVRQIKISCLNVVCDGQRSIPDLPARREGGIRLANVFCSI